MFVIVKGIKLYQGVDKFGDTNYRAADGSFHIYFLDGMWTAYGYGWQSEPYSYLDDAVESAKNEGRSINV